MVWFRVRRKLPLNRTEPDHGIPNLKVLKIIQKYTILLVPATMNLVFLESWLHTTTCAVSRTTLDANHLATWLKIHENTRTHCQKPTCRIGSISTATGTKLIVVIN
jgi:hypothetical protein